MAVNALSFCLSGTKSIRSMHDTSRFFLDCLDTPKRDSSSARLQVSIFYDKCLCVQPTPYVENQTAKIYYDDVVQPNEPECTGSRV